MTQRVQFGRRLAVILLILLAVVFSQAAAVAHYQQHQEDAGHYCLLCHAGPLPLLQTGILLPGAPAVSVAWLVVNPDSASPLDALLPVASSRAPPAA